MKEKYNVYINEVLEHQGLSEEEFFDLMEDYSEGFYTNGAPDPGSITFKITVED